MLFIDRKRRNPKGQEDSDKERQLWNHDDLPAESNDAQGAELHGQSRTAGLECEKNAVAYEKDGNAMVAELQDEQRAELPWPTHHENSGSQMIAELPAELPAELLAYTKHRESK